MKVVHILSLLIIASIIGLIVTHAAGFSADSMVAGNVLDNTLKVVGGEGRPAGTSGSFNLGNHQTFSLS